MIFPPKIRMFQVRWSMCTYRCGECDYLETDWWVQHQIHYMSHREADRLAAMEEESHASR